MRPLMALNTAQTGERESGLLTDAHGYWNQRAHKYNGFQCEKGSYFGMNGKQINLLVFGMECVAVWKRFFFFLK